MAERVPVPPKGQLLSGHEVKRVAFGWDLTVRLQSLNLSADLNEQEVVAIAFIQLGGWMRDRGVDVRALLGMVENA